MSRRPPPDTRNAGRMYWKAATEGRLVLPHCTSCDRPFWHPRPHCPRCGSSAVVWNEASGRGSVHTFTIVRQSPDEQFRNRVPYVVAMIDLDEGVRIMSSVIYCDAESVTIGMRVRCTFECLDDAVGIPLFVPETNAG